MDIKPCCKPDCIEPRHLTASYCHPHLKEYDREYTQRPERKQYRREYICKWRQDNPEYRRSHRQERNQSLLKRCYLVLGDRCIICGYQGDALQIDHVNGNISKESTPQARANVAKGNAIDYQLLCANCNWERWLTVEEQARHL